MLLTNTLSEHFPNGHSVLLPQSVSNFFWKVIIQSQRELLSVLFPPVLDMPGVAEKLLLEKLLTDFI
jgi:hypothetical protein